MTVDATRIRPAVLNKPSTILGGAVAAGIAFDLLALGRPHGPGLAMALLAIVLTVVWAAGSEGVLDTEPTALATAAGAFALVPVWRDSTVLVTLSVLAWIVLVAALIRAAGGPRIGSWTIGSYFRAGVEMLISLGEPVAIVSTDLAGRASSSTVSRLARVIPLARGVGLGALVVGFFAVLLGSADPIFGQILADTFDLDLSFERIVRFGVVTTLIAWWTAGLARRAARRPGAEQPYHPAGRALTEARVVTVALNALFAAFVAVQIDYLFAGEVGRVSLGYAEYARRGFFELVTVAVCVAGLILSVDWIVHRRDRFLDAAHILLVVQTFVIMASALLRMKAYVDAYGLSELRLYTTVFMFWTAVVLLALLATVLRDRRDRFALAAFVSAMVFVLGLIVANPDARIAAVNIDRADADVELDVDYLARLSNDAVPSIIERLSAGGDPTLDDALTRLIPIWSDNLTSDAADGWRSWSLADHSARQAVEPS